MQGNLSFDALKKAVKERRIDTVLVCMIDMQGRLMGKRLQASHFVAHGFGESHCCNYLLATDLAMHTVSGYAATSWERGYGDYIMRPDLDTLREIPWLEGTALVLCDVLDHHSHEPVAHSPRSMLKKQLSRLEALGFQARMATELEFFLFEETLEKLRKQGYRKLRPLSGYNEDYHIFQTTKEEAVLRPLRNHLAAAGIPVEGTKGEAEAGQAELNIRYGEGVLAADYHAISKHAVKEIAWAAGRSASFLPKWRADRVGSSSHVHQSLLDAKGETVFYDAGAPHGMSKIMRHYLAGLIAHAPAITWFLAPYVNSYKRFQKGSFAPTRTVWSVDNRTAAFRLVGEDTPAVRVECRIGGSDLNPYLAMSAMLAAGIDGIERRLDLAPPAEGDAYDPGADGRVGQIPHTLRDAITALRASDMLREALGEDVLAHYVRAAEWEQEAFDAAVTDWEIARGFELC